MRKLTRVLIAMALSSFFIGASGCTPKQPITSVPAEEFSKMIKADDIQLVDVRTPEEYSEAHISGAINIDVKAVDFQEKANESLEKDKPVYVYCRSGKRSLDAADILAGNGFNVVNLGGGIVEWTDKNFPVTDGQPE